MERTGKIIFLFSVNLPENPIGKVPIKGPLAHVSRTAEVSPLGHPFLPVLAESWTGKPKQTALSR